MAACASRSPDKKRGLNNSNAAFKELCVQTLRESAFAFQSINRQLPAAVISIRTLQACEKKHIKATRQLAMYSYHTTFSRPGQIQARTIFLVVHPNRHNVGENK